MKPKITLTKLNKEEFNYKEFKKLLKHTLKILDENIRLKARIKRLKNNKR